MPAISLHQERDSLEIEITYLFPIMQLPVEVRQKIWKSVMIFDKPISVEHHDRVLSQPIYLRSGKQVKMHIIEQEQRRLCSPFTLASTCRQIYLEVVPIYYGTNTFILDSKHCLHFLKTIGAENVRAITSIQWAMPEPWTHWLCLSWPALEDKTLPELDSLYGCVYTLLQDRTPRQCHSSEVKEGIRTYPKLDIDLNEHRALACKDCVMHMRQHMDLLLSESNNPGYGRLNMTNNSLVALQHRTQDGRTRVLSPESDSESGPGSDPESDPESD